VIVRISTEGQYDLPDGDADRLNDLGLNREKGEETIRTLLQGVTDAAKASGQAALDAARNKG